MSCQTLPTLTQFGTITSTSTSTTFSQSVTTLPDSTSTTVITSCLDTVTASDSSATAQPSCASSTLITSASVITGGVSTVQVPITVPVEFTTTTPTATLFSTTCTTTDGGTTPPTTTPPVSTPDSTTTTEVTTPTLTFTTSVDTTLPNGQVTQTALTVTTTLPPSTSIVTVPQPSTQGTGTGGKSSGVSVGPIVGGAVGGFIGLIALVGLLWYFCRRRANWDDIFEKDYEEYAGAAVRPTRSRMLDMEDEPVPSESLVNTEPKPYQYGLVGAGGRTPPSLNAGLPPTPLNGGFPQTGAKNAGQLGGHTRTLSETPLMLNVQPGVGGPGPLLTPSSTGSRPSTGGSYNAYPGAGPSSTGHGNMMMSNAPPPPRVPSPGSGPLGVSINTGPSLGMDMMTAGRTSAENYNLNAPDSPTSIVSPPRKLFIANQVDAPASPPPVSSSRPGSPGSPMSSNHGAGPSSFSGALAGTAAGGQRNNSSNGFPSAAEEKARLQHNASIGGVSAVSTQSAYSQPSAPPSAYHGFTGSGSGSGAGQAPLPPGAQRAVSPQSFSTARAQSPQTELAYLSDPEEVPSPSRRTERRTSQGVIVHHDAGHLDADAAPPPAYVN